MNTTKEHIGWRRVTVFGLSLVAVYAAATSAHGLLSANGTTNLERLWLVFFLSCFACIALAFWTQVAGFLSVALRLRTRGLAWPTTSEATWPLQTRTAIVLPVHNEDAVTVFANVRAILESVDATGHGAAFDLFVLSDSTDVDAWVSEQREWATLCAQLGTGRVFYRRRSQNTAKKAGNVADFCRRWGNRYDFMIVLDADSLMTGETLVTMARLMEKNPTAGIIQAPPVAIGSRTLFARLQQFAGFLYGGVNAAGLAFWQSGDSNYWGHNAIIRTAAFMEHCGLPVLKGPPPFGGHILSHDFVEAALIRRAGYRVWLVPELGGSYEQLPPTLLDYAGRDRRWCQGNLQHLPLLFAEGLHPMSRVHFAMGIMAYAASLLCLLFLSTGFACFLQESFTTPQYFTHERSLFPTWRTFDAELAMALGLTSLSLLLLPKVLALGLQLARGPRSFGVAARLVVSFLLETVWSVLISPSMMLFQSLFVVSTLLGAKVEWGAQNRDERSVTWEEAVDRQGSHAFFGAAILLTVWAAAPSLLPWLAPLITGLLSCMALTVLSSSPAVGAWFRRMRLFETTEEVEVPAVWTRAQAFADERRRALVEHPEHEMDGIERVLTSPAANALHLSLLAAEPMPSIDRAAALRAREKVERGAKGSLTPEEKRALLLDADALYELHLAELAA